MRDQSAHPGPKLDADIDLLNAIYQAALLPENYDALVETWSTRLEDVLDRMPEGVLDAPDLALQIDLSDSIEYLNTSLQVFEKLARARPAPTPEGDASSAALPKLVLAEDGQVVWYNSAAMRLYDLSRNSTLATLPMDTGSRQRVQAALTENRKSDASGGRLPLVVFLHGGSADAGCFMLARPLQDSGAARLLVLEQADTEWNDTINAVLQASFGLTRAETDIVASLCDGKSVSRIAEQRGRQMSTLRAQIKSILRKTNTHSQAQLIRLCLSLVSHIGAVAQDSTEPGRPLRFHTLPCGRRVPFHDIGPADGQPVLFLHGMLDGLSFLPEFRQLLDAHKLRLIAPERPSFGSAASCGRAIADVPDGVAADALHLLRAAGLRDVRLLGHMAGSVYSFALAAQAPQMVRGIVNVAAGVPITSVAQFRHMSARQRTVAYTARFTPSALPLILHAGIRQIDSGGVDRFIEALYAASPRDLAAWSRPAISTAISEGVKFAVAQGHRAFEIDSYHVVRDWSARAQSTTCPVALIHGRHDPVVSARSVEAFGKSLGGRARVDIAEDAGQTVLYTHPQMVIEALSRV